MGVYPLFRYLRHQLPVDRTYFTSTAPPGRRQNTRRTGDKHSPQPTISFFKESKMVLGKTEPAFFRPDEGLIATP